MPSTLYSTVYSTNLQTSVGGAPSAGDTVVVNQGNQTFTTGMAWGAIALAGFIMPPAFTGSIGDGTNYLDLIATTGKFKCNFGGRACYIGGTAGTIQTVEIGPTNNGFVTISGKTLTYVTVTAGTLYVQDTTDAENVYAQGGTTVLMPSGTHTGTVVECSGSATVQVGRVYATVRCHEGGKVTYTRDDVPPSTGMEINGGTVEYLGGDIPAFTGRAGTLDLRRATKDITITNPVLYEGLTILFPLGDITITWAGTVTIRGRDPRLPR